MAAAVRAVDSGGHGRPVPLIYGFRKSRSPETINPSHLFLLIHFLPQSKLQIRSLGGVTLVLGFYLN